MELELGGRAAIVTGGSRGIGAAIALGLAREGVSVAITHLGDAEGAETAAAAIRECGQAVLVVESDVSDFAAAEATVARAAEEFGRLDVLVCNAGITADSVSWKMDEAQWDRVLAVNLKGCFNYCRAAIPHFRNAQSGRIINITSINGLRGKFGQVNYAASKGGMVALTKTLAKEVGKFGVTVNAVAPGMVLTEMMQAVPEEYRAGLDVYFDVLEGKKIE